MTDVGGDAIPDADEPVINHRAEDLWGLPNESGHYLTGIVEHGDDMSEEDYSIVANRLLGALVQAAQAYGYEGRTWDVNKSLVGNDWNNPLLAELPDGTVVAARSTSRRDSARHQDTRRPTPQEHARWAGLPIPPEPPPPPPPPPSTFDIIWDRLTQHAGEVFTKIRGGEFTYESHPYSLSITAGSGRNVSVARSEIVSAIPPWPVPGPSALPVACGYDTSYVWALLADDRILGLREPSTGDPDVGASTHTDPFAPAPLWLTDPHETDSRAPQRVSDLFDPTPDRWGLRGDPFLWEVLRARLAGSLVPESPTDLQTLLLEIFEDVVGVDPFSRNAPESVAVRQLAQDGMPSNRIQLATWRDLLLPMLVGRSIGRRPR